MKMFLTRIGFGSKAVVTGRHDPGRPAQRAQRHGGPRADPGRHRRPGVRAPDVARRGPAPHRAGHRRRLRAGRPGRPLGRGHRDDLRPTGTPPARPAPATTPTSPPAPARGTGPRGRRAGLRQRRAVGGRGRRGPLGRAGPQRAARGGRAGRGRAVAPLRRRGGHRRAQQAVHGQDGPTDVLAFPIDDPISGRWPDAGTTGPTATSSTTTTCRCCWATWWCARPWPAQAPSTPAPTTTRSPCSSCTASSTCSATTTPSPRRRR